jgi:hypothetical protein
LWREIHNLIPALLLVKEKGFKISLSLVRRGIKGEVEGQL